jgi:pyruvate ferredoxin oxidoreductase gamma subunit/2-oxoisovalerate ferredoxin oxidoreductase gamma subunit
MIELRFHGRGGQGAVVASKILASALFKDGKYVQAFPEFGVERRGAPVTAFLRWGDPDEPFTRCNIYEPDHIIVMDHTLIRAVNCLRGLKLGGLILINSKEPAERFRIPAGFRVFSVDASGIARKWKLGSTAQPVVNTALIGAFNSLLDVVSEESLESAIRDEAPVKPDENVSAAREAGAAVRRLPALSSGG